MRGRACWPAWGILAVTILLTAVIGAILACDVAILGHTLDTSDNGLRFEVPIFGVGLVAVGAVVASRLPRNPVGWIFCPAASRARRSH